MVITEVVMTQRFEEETKHIKEPLIKERIKKQIKKITENPNIGKPLRYSLKSERTLYIKPYRLIYTTNGATLILLRFEHRKKVYD